MQSKLDCRWPGHCARAHTCLWESQVVLSKGQWIWRIQVCSEGHLPHPHSQHELISTPVHTHRLWYSQV